MKQSKKHAIKQFVISMAAVVLVSSLLAGWAVQDGFTYAAAGNDSFSEEEYEKLLALQWDGYEEMSIFEYQRAVWAITDTEEYRNLLERFSQSKAFYECRDYDETAAFFFSVLEPLTAGDDKWRTREFGGYAASSGLSGLTASADHAGLEFFQEIADSYSTRQLTIHIREDGVSCECMDERSVFEEQRSLQEPLAQERSAAYKKLLKYKTEDYLQQSVAAFNASIAPTGDALGEALDAYAQAAAEGIDAEDENYEFLKVTLQASLSELYCEVFVDDTPYFPIYLSREERPYAYMGPTGGDMFYEFMFYALANVSYRVTSPETLTVEERDRALRTCREELQSYVDSLSEDDILYGNIRAALTRKAEELAFRYSGGGMELSIEIGHIDMFDM